MDGVQESPSQAAGRWYARLRAPDCTAEERQEFEAWRARDPRHAAAYAAAERLNDALANLAMANPRLKAMVDQAAGAGAALPDEPEEPSAGKPPPLTITASPKLGNRPRIARRFAWAASVLVAFGAVVALLSLSASGPDAQAAIRYNSGAERRTVTLDDGTRVQLDIASVIEVPVNSRRSLTLVQGRALFAAAHDPLHAFAVTVGNARVTTYGTLFQVDHAASEVIVTAAEGSVTLTDATGSETVRLLPGEELRSSADGTRWSKRRVDAESAMSWSLGRHILGSATTPSSRVHSRWRTSPAAG